MLGAVDHALVLAGAAENLFPARMQMALSLGWHIVFSCFGIAFPTIVVFTEWRAHTRGNPMLLDLAHTWAKAMGVLFAAGAVSGTLLSFEMGILWPGLMAPFGEVYGFPFVLEGFAFFLEAIFVGHLPLRLGPDVAARAHAERVADHRRPAWRARSS